MLAVFCYLVGDPFRSDDPADQDTSQQGNEWHQETVADIIHQVQKLGGGAVGQRQLKIEDIVAKTDQHGSDQGVDADDRAHAFAGFVEQFHAVGNQGLHNGYAGGQRRKCQHKEERQTNEPANSPHGEKDFRKGDKGQAWAGGHAVSA